MNRKKLWGLAFAAGLLCSMAGAQEKMILRIDKPGGSIAPTMWGVFFEDINLGADGGLYAELVKNRSFEFAKPMMGWTVQGRRFEEGDILVENRGEENKANPRYIRVNVKGAVKGDLGLSNEGFRGMGIRNGLRYDFSVMYRQAVPGVKLHVELADSAGNVIGGTTVLPAESGAGWHKAAAHFSATATAMKAKMNIWFEGEGLIDLDMVSLFPGDTWKHRQGGMRADMVQMLADMKPGFIRFPGGCIVEGIDLNNRYQWKRTLGPVEDRQLIMNRWNVEFAHRPAPDYFQSFGLGFFEYFQLAEDIGAEPLPILNCGMACQFNSAEVATMDELGPYIQDALDLVEFANGAVSTKWGKIRADMGHPAPFHLKMMGIGNENWGPQYIERLKAFTAAIRARYPEIKLVNSSGTDPNGERFDYLNNQLRKMNADIIDEHYYRRPEWFLQNARRYDNYPRSGPRIFAGEYAAQSEKTASPTNRNNWQAALAEAAFMTGLERNADLVCMASYAPLFAHVEGWQWTPDMIWVNNLRVFGTPDYFVQKLFSLNKGTRVLPITMGKEAVAGQDSLYASGVLDEKTDEVIIKLVNVSVSEREASVEIAGGQTLRGKGTLTILKSNDLQGVNTFDSPENLAPRASEIDLRGREITLKAAPYSLSVLRVKLHGGKPGRRSPMH